ncbi:MAG: hypothetical protein KIT10_08985 [Flavobacteriales bacterium]|nr:hypothetical protein [Flavobacteriales bacterium]MCW5899387.1 hypothetical protein [Flavobacteriales bacterium]
MKLFNKVRQRLLDEGRLKRYLVYAAGEIVLVVVGILIALQLNAWKSDVKDRSLEQTYLWNLRDDLVLQQEIIEDQIAHEASKVVLADSAMACFMSGCPLDVLEDLLTGAGKLYQRKTFIANQPTFNDLVSSGNMALLRDVKVKAELMRYHQELELQATVINTNNRLLIDQQFGQSMMGNALGFVLNEHGDVDNTQRLNGAQRYSLRTLLRMRKRISELHRDRCMALQEHTGTMIALLDMSIKQD